MIQITPQMRILVAIDPVDFRRGIDGLAQACRAVLHEDPFTGTVFIFRNRDRTAIKLLVYDGQGFWLCHKRLSASKFRHWPTSPEAASALQAHELQVLLCAGNPMTTEAAPAWRRLAGVAVGSPMHFGRDNLPVPMPGCRHGASG
jgi:transposase